METFPPPHPAIGLSTHLYYQLVYTLTNLLPPPLDDMPEALRTRNHAAIAKVAALLPSNADKADLAVRCIAARTQAKKMLRLNAHYGSMVPTSLSVHGRPMRVQALRQKREAIDGVATEDAQALHTAERSMLGAVEPDAQPLQAASPGGARAMWPNAAPEAAPVEASAGDVDRTSGKCLKKRDRFSGPGF